MDFLKTLLQGLPSTPEFTTNASMVQVIMLVIQLPWGDLSVACLTVRVRCGVFLQDLDAILPVHPMKVVPKSSSGVGQLRAPWIGEMKTSNT